MSEQECDSSPNKEFKSDLVILGGGSAAFSAALRASSLGAKVTLINSGLPIGGTCLNVGCVPSKTLIRAAQALYGATHHAFKGIESTSKLKDFKAVIAQKRELILELRQAKYVDPVQDDPNIQIINGYGKIVSEHTVSVGERLIEAPAILIATGASPFLPPVPGLKETGCLNNESAFELEKLPQSLIVLGGRYIALEISQMFARFGSQVTILQRSPRILPSEKEDLTSALTGFLTSEGIQIETGVVLRNVRRENGLIIVSAEQNGIVREFRATHILAATGRVPNTHDIGLGQAKINTDTAGFIQVNADLSANNSGAFSAGDVIGEPMFVYTAAYEGALAAENAILKTHKERDYTALPWVIFTDPQVAGVGLDENQAAEKGLPVDISVLPLSHVPRSLAARDTRGFIKLIRERSTDKIVGARILAPEGSELLMEISLAIKFGLTSKQIVNSFHPYLTLSEGVKLAAIAFDKKVEKLSCCAS